MKLSIIIVNWNSAEFLRACIHTIRANTKGLDYEIIVVDSASSGDDVERIGLEFPSITLIASRENLGFARANNLGFRHSTGEYVLFLNPDTELVGASINQLLEVIERLPKAGIIGAKLLNSDGSVQLTSIRPFPGVLSQMLETDYLLRAWPSCPLWDISPLFSEGTEAVEVDVISGACMLMRRQVFQEAGEFSEDYFMYAEDIDLNYKVRKASFRNFYVGAAVVIHHGGKSSGQRTSYWSTVMQHRAMLNYFRKTRGEAYGLLFRAAMGTAAGCRLAALALAYPWGWIKGKQNSLGYAMGKWSAVLAWSAGRVLYRVPERQ
jgi:GT2 family glycosyltransferase